MDKFSLKLIILLFPILLIHGCGYALRSAISEDIKSISIETFQNKTFEHAIEVELSKAIKQEFINNGTLSVVDADSSDIQLKGEITRYLIEPYTYGSNQADVQQYKITVYTDVTLSQTSSRETMWQEKNMKGDALYHTSGSQARGEGDALQEALEELARSIVLRTVIGW